MDVFFVRMVVTVIPGVTMMQYFYYHVEQRISSPLHSSLNIYRPTVSYLTEITIDLGNTYILR